MMSFTSNRAFCGPVFVASWRIRWITSAARWPSFTIASRASRTLSRSGTAAANQLSDALASATMGGERLVDLVGDRRSQLAQGRHAGQVGELRLGLLQRFRGPYQI